MSIVTAMYWLTVFHFASREAGTITPTPAATARRPVTASSRPMMMTTIHAATRSMVSNDTRAAVTSSLSATGSRSVPSVVTWLRRRAMRPSSQSVREASEKMPAAMSACTREEEMRNRISSGTAMIRVRVRPIGRFTPGPLFARPNDLVNVGAVHRHERGGIERQAGGDVGAAARRRQVARPPGVRPEARDVLAVPPRQRERSGRGGRGGGAGLGGERALDEHPCAHVVLERDGAPLAGAGHQHV